MKRITLWIDCQDEDVESVKKRFEAMLRSLKVRYTILKSLPELVMEDTC